MENPSCYNEFGLHLVTDDYGIETSDDPNDYTWKDSGKWRSLYKRFYLQKEKFKWYERQTKVSSGILKYIEMST